MLDSKTFARSVTIILESLAPAAAIEYTRLPGWEIPESIFKMTTGKPKPIK
jgi:hypothetical protein